MINFTDDFRAITDEYSVMLQEKKVRKKKGTEETYEKWQTVSYHADYEQAADALVCRKIRMCKSAEEIIKSIKELRKMIKGLKFPKK